MALDEAQRRVLEFFALSEELDPGAFVIADAATDRGAGLDPPTVYAAIEVLAAAGLLERDPPDGHVTGLTRVRITPKGANLVRQWHLERVKRTDPPALLSTFYEQ